MRSKDEILNEICTYKTEINRLKNNQTSHTEFQKQSLILQYEMCVNTFYYDEYEILKKKFNK